MLKYFNIFSYIGHYFQFFEIVLLVRLLEYLSFEILHHVSFSLWAAAEVTQRSWEDSVLKSETPVLVEFYTSWCGPCRMVHRIIDEIAGDYAGKLNCYLLNADNDLPVAEEYEIKAVPVVLLFKNGEKRESIMGTMPKEFYISAIERVLNSWRR